MKEGMEFGVEQDVELLESTKRIVDGTGALFVRSWRKAGYLAVTATAMGKFDVVEGGVRGNHGEPCT